MQQTELFYNTYFRPQDNLGSPVKFCWKKLVISLLRGTTVSLVSICHILVNAQRVAAAW